MKSGRTVASYDEPNSFSPVPVRTSTTSSLDIGASPPPLDDAGPVEDYGIPHRVVDRRPLVNSGAVWGNPSKRQSVEPEIIVAPAAAVDVTTQLSDMSGEGSLIIEAEQRMAAYDTYGSAAALVDFRQPPAATRTSPPQPATTTSPTVLPSPVNTFSLMTMKKKVILMTVAVEFEVGKTDMIPIYEGEDGEADCAKLAAAFVESHELDTAVILPLTEHLIRTVELQKNGELSESDNDSGDENNNHVVPSSAPSTVVQNSHAKQGSGMERSSQQARAHRQQHAPPPLVEEDLQARSVNPSSSGPATVRSVPRAARPVSPAGSTRMDPHNGSFASSRGGALSTSQRGRGGAAPRATNFVRTISRESTPVTAQESQSFMMNPQYAHVSSRYRSPTKRSVEPPPLPPSICTHKPQVCEGTKAIVDTQVRHRRTLYERLYSENEGILARKRELSEQRARAASEQRKYTDHQVKGLNWETATSSAANATAAGQRLYHQAIKQRQALAQKQARAQEERDKKELATLVFHPKVNPTKGSDSASSNRHRDPFHISPAPKAKRAALTTEEKEILTHCTFHPQVVNVKASAAGTPSTNRALFEGAKQEPSRSPTRPISPSMRPTTPQTTAATTPSDSALFEELRAKSPSGRKLPRDEISSLTSRLYEEARKKEERMQAARYRHETVDPKTGRPLYRPFVGR